MIKKINDAFASDEDAQRVVREVAYSALSRTRTSCLSSVASALR